MSWLGLVCSGVYFGYTLTFYLKLGTQDCTHASLRQYANGYFIDAIIGGVMTFVSLTNYFVTIGIRPEPTHMEESLFKS